MRRIVFVRHSETKRVPGINSHQWSLTEEGERRVILLADRLREYDLSQVISSPEAKCLQTGEPIAEALGIPFSTLDDLREHDRSSEVYKADTSNFTSTIVRLFDEPDKLVYGTETADQAHARFNQAVQRAQFQHPQGNLCIVTHATVLTLFVSRKSELQPFEFWSKLGMPAFVVFEVPGWTLLEVVENVTITSENA